MLYNVDSHLGQLAGEGAAMTVALLSSSPAIDTASCMTGGFSPTSDQRGATMPVDGDDSGTAECDMGSYEFLSIPPEEQLIFLDGFE